MLSQQLEEDIRHLGSHKYIAHQLAVIYVRHTRQNSAVNQTVLFPLFALEVLLFFLLHFFFAICLPASHLLFPGDPGSVWHKAKYRGQLQTDETVSGCRRRIPARAPAGRSLHQLVSYSLRSHLQTLTNAATTRPQYSFSCRILEITQSLTSLVLSLPEELTDDIHQAVAFVSQFLSWCHKVYELNQSIASFSVGKQYEYFPETLNLCPLIKHHFMSTGLNIPVPLIFLLLSSPSGIPDLKTMYTILNI